MNILNQVMVPRDATNRQIDPKIVGYSVIPKGLLSLTNFRAIEYST
jgi:hypothetical protein